MKNHSDSELENRVRDAKAARVGEPKAHRLLRLAEVTSLVPMSRSSILRNVAAGKFPQPIKMGGVLFWIESEIDAFIEALIAGRPAPIGAH